MIYLCQRRYRSLQKWFLDGLAIVPCETPEVCSETWCASRMYGSPHRKEFVFLAGSIDASILHRRCDKQRERIRIERKWSNPSATYID